ncbi:MAG: FkbM family methyltransferase [Patescibacteria group bacterium]
MKHAVKTMLKRFLALPYYCWNKFVTKDFQKKQVSRWYIYNGENKLLTDHEISEKSVVVDIGGYTGVFSDAIVQKYNPYIYIFEPIKEYANLLEKKYNDNNKVTVLKSGVWTKTMKKDIQKSGESSSLYIRGNQQDSKVEEIELMDISEILTKYGLSNIDLCSMNIEGAEYELLEAIIDRSIIDRIGTLQIQFHQNVLDHVSRREKIINSILATHKTQYSYPYVWECFKKY